ncbi:MAG TPA: DUF4192 domain-containing protein [Jatrophihabitans sp.]|nr:DUF4192 domain-containing protein [Jatrophihabitans sp.]
MTTGDIPAIRVTTPGDLIEAVPYLLGFHPSESLVVIGFDEVAGTARQVTITARLDVGPDGVERAAVASLVGVLKRSGTGAVAAVLLSERVTADPCRPGWVQGVLAGLSAELQRGGLRLLDVLAADRSRWWSLCCQNPACCPPEGTVRSGQGSAVAAEATYAGLVAMPDRQALVAGLDGASPATRAALLPALRRADTRFAELLGRIGASRTRRNEHAALLRAAAECESGTQLSPRRLARLGAALRDTEIRDALWLALDDRSLSAESMLSQLHSRLPPPYQAAPLFLFGWQLWRSGSGTLAAAAAERALRADPGYSAAGLLLEAVQAGLDPRRTPPLTGSPGRRQDRARQGRAQPERAREERAQQERAQQDHGRQDGGRQERARQDRGRPGGECRPGR